MSILLKGPYFNIYSISEMHGNNGFSFCSTRWWYCVSLQNMDFFNEDS
jgi:hypothetical protein